LIQDQAGKLAKFLLDLLEVAKCYYLANGTQPSMDDGHMLYKDFNELDLSENMNQHAVLCQVRRLALSVILYSPEFVHVCHFQGYLDK
jgi:hypothetical protein